MTTTQTLKIGQQIPLKIKRLGINGEGIGFYKKLIVFVPNALPKEEVLVKVTKLTNKFAEAQLISIRKESPDRVTPPCTVYEECGGCQLQHLTYQGQLSFKTDLLKQALRKYQPQGFQSYTILPTIGMSEPWHYRNKAQFQLQKNALGEIEAGLYKQNSHQLVPITDCLVQEEHTQKVINIVTDLLNKYDLPIYDEKKNSGIFRTLMVRVGIQTGEIQLVFITYSKKFPKQTVLLQEIQDALPEVVSIMQNIQPTKSSVIMGDETIHLWGKETIQEKINQVTFDLSPRAFFQLNPQQTNTLYREGIKALAVEKDDRIIDAYCGVGTIGLSLAQEVAEVRGMDTISQAIADAKRNAQRLGVTNTLYETGTAETIIPNWIKDGFTPTGMVVDPPRTGLDQKLLQTIIEYPVEKLVYISCNVSTLARDLVTLTKGYQVEYLQSVDMFPHTARCEVVVKMQKRT